MKRTFILALALFSMGGCGSPQSMSAPTTAPLQTPPPTPTPSQIVSGPFNVGSAFSQPNQALNPSPATILWNITINTFPVDAYTTKRSSCGILGQLICLSDYLMLTNLRNSSLRLDLPIDEIEVDANFDNTGSGSGTISPSILIQLTTDGNYDPNAAGAAFGIGQLPQKFVARRTLADWAKPNLTPAQAATANFGLGLLVNSSETEVHAVQVIFYQHE